MTINYQILHKMSLTRTFYGAMMTTNNSSKFVYTLVLSCSAGTCPAFKEAGHGPALHAQKIYENITTPPKTRVFRK